MYTLIMAAQMAAGLAERFSVGVMAGLQKNGWIIPGGRKIVNEGGRTNEE
jgi:hypothetical protein